jgi:hypothetical protein
MSDETMNEEKTPEVDPMAAPMTEAPVTPVEPTAAPDAEPAATPGVSEEPAAE